MGYSYDAAGYLTGDGTGTPYSYDALNRLVALTMKTGQTQNSSYNGDGVLVGPVCVLR